MLVGGRIQKSTEEMAMYFTTMQSIAQAMSEKNNWNYLAQYSIIKEMHKDLNKIIHKFWVTIRTPQYLHA